ncbi:MAG: DUF1302 family protein [Candidatus Binatia bacterium]
MVRRQAWPAVLTAATLLLVSSIALCASMAAALTLDDDRNITLRARIYSQAAIRIQDSAPDTAPVTKSGQLIQHRNFFYPELDAKLTSYTAWMRGGWLDWLAPDDLRFRATAWGFYDGLYDYGASQFDAAQKVINASFDNRVPRQGPINLRAGGWFVRGENIKLVPGATRFNQVFPDFELYDPPDIYAHQARVNELYLSYTKGPLFVRFGRQSISWGESDTIALLDQSNPFDLTLAAPGFFEDIEESRIPLYTLRTSYTLFDVWGRFSSGMLEGYWVPGDLDATTPITPLITASPYSPRGKDPQLASQQSGGVFPPTFQFVFLDHLPKSGMESSRWGIRFQTVIDGAYTLQAWAYRTLPQNPVPVKIGRQDNLPFSINGTNLFIVSIEHKPVMVYGVAATFFAEPLDGILRLNAQLFEHEQGFIPQANLNICPISRTQPMVCPGGRNPISSPGYIPYNDILRYEIGFDRFFFLRSLNPSNSFVLSASAVGSYNASYTGASDAHFRSPQLKPSLFRRLPDGGLQPVQRGAVQSDYVNTYPLDAQGQMTIQTDYLHGRLIPRLTLIGYVRGTYAIHPTLIYRWTDSLLFQADWQHIDGAYQALGFFRDRDQVALRVTYQLN